MEPPQTTSKNISKIHPLRSSKVHHTSFFRGCIRYRQSPTRLGETSLPHENGTCRTAENPHFFTGKRCSKILKHLEYSRILESKYYLAMGRKKSYNVECVHFYPYLRGDRIQPQLNPFSNFESRNLFLHLRRTNRRSPLEKLPSPPHLLVLSSMHS